MRTLNAKEAERARKQGYLDAMEQQALELNEKLSQRNNDLSSVLPKTLDVDDAIDFDDLRIKGNYVHQQVPRDLIQARPAPTFESYFSEITKPHKLAMILFPWVRRRFEREVEAATARARADLKKHQEAEADRTAKLTAARAESQRAEDDFKLKVAMRDAEVDAFVQDYMDGDADAIVAYCSMVLERSSYPDDFPQNFSVAYQTASKQLVVEYELPPPGAIPVYESYRYIRTRDAIDAKPRRPADIKAAYADLVAAIVLRTIHEILEADRGDHIVAACVNAYVRAVDPATGRDISSHLVSVRTTKEIFNDIDLRRVDKGICLKNLGAHVSRSPKEIQPVKPIVEFKMADARFVDQHDLVSELSDATNLIELNPFQFEELVANLFGKMGLESKLTRSSRDGGVDCVAFDPRPVLGGKVVIQAKRYKHAVGVSAVRDLYGTMMNEGASKGLLVTTSGYGPDAFNFAKDKPIELIDGGGLLYLLQEIGVSARIVMPEDASP